MVRNPFKKNPDKRYVNPELRNAKTARNTFWGAAGALLAGAAFGIEELITVIGWQDTRLPDDVSVSDALSNPTIQQMVCEASSGHYTAVTGFMVAGTIIVGSVYLIARGLMAHRQVKYLEQNAKDEQSYGQAMLEKAKAEGPRRADVTLLNGALADAYIVSGAIDPEHVYVAVDPAKMKPETMLVTDKAEVIYAAPFVPPIKKG